MNGLAFCTELLKLPLGFLRERRGRYLKRRHNGELLRSVTATLSIRMSTTTSTASHFVTTKRHRVVDSCHDVDDGADVLRALLERPGGDLDAVAMLEALKVVEHGQRL